ncbi:hypothetical protein [Kribbella sp. NPDC051770]|uniref:hypothetical protein n=1 Tax=Kribbella sp. NPDC051770 TaxID=3155413 RepID=UPI00343B0708
MRTRALAVAAIVAIAPLITVGQAAAAPPTADLEVGDTVTQVLDGKTASYTLVSEKPNWGQRVRLWRNTSTGSLHGQIAFSKPGDAVWLSGPGCPGSYCNVAYVPAGSTEASTASVSRSVDVCGQHRYSDLPGTTTVCTCIVCKTEPREAARRPAATAPVARNTRNADSRLAR